jgi:two-component system, OmpR family, copper resistance phosphate regulon response regulator CusR
VRILLVEDEPHAARMLAKGLRENAYAVDVASTGPDAAYQASINEYDAIILDLVLPGRDGLSICRELRERGSAIPILMLTARDGIEARISGLDSGADDYLTKPFDFRELLARLRAVIRRGQRPLIPSILRVGPLELDLRLRVASRSGKQFMLTAREYAVLEYLMLHAGQVVARADLLEHVWESAHEPLSNVIDVCVQRVRRKIDAPGKPSLIVTRRGEGYVLAATPERNPR